MDIDSIAVVIGAGSYNDLGIIRSCGEQKKMVIYITNKKHIIPIHRSRYILKTIFVPFIEDVFMETLLQVIDEYKIPVVIYPASDIAAYFLDKNYIRLKGKCYFSHANGHLEYQMNKYTMMQTALESGLQTPKTFQFNLLDNNDYSCISYPCIIKPLMSIAGEKSDITRCNTCKELMEAINLYIRKHHDNIIIQEYIMGKRQREIAVTGICSPNGEVILYGEIEKMRIRGNGSTVFGIYRPMKKRNFYENIEKYIKRTLYIGIFDIEFLENENGLYFIECNFRNGAYGYATTKAGFNMPYLFFQKSLGKSFLLCDLKDTVFMEERSDFLNVLEKRITLLEWIKDLFRTDVFLFFNKRDMMPLIRIPFFIRKIFLMKAV